MRCDICGNGERRPGHRPYVVERGERVAVVTEVPVEECPACGQVWFDERVALRLDARSWTRCWLLRWSLSGPTRTSSRGLTAP